MKVQVILLISLAYHFTIIGCSPKIISINENNHNQQFLIKQGDIVEVCLKANPSTGYRWQIVKIDTFKIKLIDESYTSENNNKDIVGKGGSKIYLFKAINKGSASIEIEYSRPFENDIPPLKEFNFNLSIP
jgi:inhibitor of cysteine peptidase